MDTNAKKWIKKRGVIFIATLLIFALMSGMLYYVGKMAVMFEEDLWLSQDKKEQLSVTDTKAFRRQLHQDVQNLAAKAGSAKEKNMQDAILARQADYQRDFLTQYRTRKANYILSYLFEALCEADVNTAYASYFNIDAEFTVPTATLYNRVAVNPEAPDFVQKIQWVVNGTESEDFILYEALIPAQEFRDETFTYTTSVSAEGEEFTFSSDFSVNCSLAEATPEIVFEQTFIEYAQSQKFSIAEEEISEGFHYYIASSQQHDAEKSEEFMSRWRGQNIRFCFERGTLTQNSLDSAEQYGVFDNSFAEDVVVYAYVDLQSSAPHDAYCKIAHCFEQLQKTDMRILCSFILVLLTLGIILLVIFLKGCGAKKRLDVLPLDIHLAITVLLMIVSVFIGIDIIVMDGLGYFWRYGNCEELLSILFALLGALICIIVTEFFAAAVRKIRADGLVKSSIALSVVSCLLKMIRQVFKNRYKLMRRRTMLITVLWVLAMSGSVYFVATETPKELYYGITVLLFCMSAIFVLWYLQHLGDIILAAEEQRKYEGNIERLPPSLRTLVESQRLTDLKLSRAIEKAVKDERTKTELITNVSHDLKTPLTSVINYVELLSRDDVSEQQQKEYLEVLAEKSGKLKRLIEDLIEASKLSSGNVTIHKTPLSLCELISQALVEDGERFEENDLSLVYHGTSQPTVYADGSKIYRVAENLIANALKYSLPGTRVYASVYEDEEYGYFELKNTSAAPLNISPDELKDRFVRGDEARSDGGNGLGLSIADSLCDLNGGKLLLNIDGDLFKAVIKLPKATG